jgi:hypothetical protein
VKRPAPAPPHPRVAFLVGPRLARRLDDVSIVIEQELDRRSDLSADFDRGSPRERNLSYVELLDGGEAHRPAAGLPPHLAGLTDLHPLRDGLP